MLDTLRSVEQIAAGFAPPVLAAVASVVLLIGIFIWFGGFGNRRLLFLLVGAASGTIFTLYLGNANYMLAVAIIGLAAFLASKLAESFLTVIAAVIAAVFGFILLIHPYIDTSGDMLDRARSIVLDVPYYHWPVLLILVVIPIIAGFTYWQFASAICCGALGGLLIMAGVGGLMLWQGRSLVSAMSIRQSFYLGIYLGVATTGALIQVLHAKIASLKDPNKVTKIKRKGRKKRGKQAETEEQKGGGIATWRTA